MSIKMKVFCSSDKVCHFGKLQNLFKDVQGTVPWYEYVPVIRGTVISNE